MSTAPVPKYEFKPKGFQVSTNYKNLWDLISQGARVPAWLVYTDEYAPHIIWDLIEVKMNMDNRGYSIGSRGRGYEDWKQTFEGFEMVCQSNSLHFLVPMIPSDFNLKAEFK